MDDILNIDNLLPDLLKRDDNQNQKKQDTTPNQDLLKEFDFREEIVDNNQKIKTSLKEDILSAKSSFFIGA